MKKQLSINGLEVEYKIEKRDHHQIDVHYNDFVYGFRLLYQDHHSLIVTDGNQNFKLFKHNDEVYFKGRKISVQLKKLGRKSQDDAAGGLKSPMPGKILKVEKKNGDKVSKGDILIVMEAMKMEHSIKAPYDGVIKKITFKVGDQVPGDVELVEIEETKNA